MANNETNDFGLETQLEALYFEKEQLEKEIGISDAKDIIAMVQNLEEQLVDLYQEKEKKQETQIEVQIEKDRLVIYGPETIQIKKRKSRD